MLRAAVEREFEIMGEALTQLARLDEELASQITTTVASSPSGTFSFTVTQTVRRPLVWDVVETKLRPSSTRKSNTLLDAA